MSKPILLSKVTSGKKQKKMDKRKSNVVFTKLKLCSRKNEYQNRLTV